MPFRHGTRAESKSGATFGSPTGSGSSSPTGLAVPDWVDVASKASSGNGSSATPWSGWETEITWTAGTTYYFRAGIFNLAVDPAWNNLSNIRLTGDHDSQTIIQITKGAGLGMQITNATYLTTVNWIVENFQVIGNVAGTTTDCFTITNIARSSFRNLRVMNCTGAGYNITGNVLCDFQHVVCSGVYTPIFATVPTNGFILGTSGGNQTVNGCTFDECMVENVSGSGWKLTGAQFNVWNGGTSESNNRGFELTNNTSLANVFNAVDCESSSGTEDFLFSASVNNVIVGGQGTKIVHFASNAVGNTMIGGVHNQITFDVGAFDNSVYGGSVNSNNSGGLTDSDGRNHFQAVHDQFNAVGIQDQLRDSSHKTIQYGLGGALTITANAITPTRLYHTIGAGLLKTINVPIITTTGAAASNGHRLTFLPTAAGTYDATGNIGAVLGGVLTQNKFIDFVWDGTKYWPSY